MDFFVFFAMTFVFLILQTWVYQEWCFANRKWLPLLWLYVESSLHPNLVFVKQSVREEEELQYHTSLFSLGPFVKITRTHRILCLKRGSYSLKSVSIICGDPLGLQKKYEYIPVQGTLLVYPKVVDLEDLVLPAHTELGEWIVKRWILPDPFLRSGVRPYQAGDPQKQIHWKATARAGSLQVHQLDFTANQRLMIYLNFMTSEDIWDTVTEPELIEEGLAYAASIARFALEKGMDVGFGCNGLIPGVSESSWVRLEPGRSAEQLHRILTVMAQLVIKPNGLFSRFLEAEQAYRMTGTEFLILTSVDTEGIRLQAERLRSHGNWVQVLPMDVMAE